MEKKWTGLYSAAIVFTVAVCIWTFSHNVDLYGQGLSSKSRTIGIIGSLFAEIFVLWSTFQSLKYGGDRGRAARRAALVMLGILLINTIIAHLKNAGGTRSLGYLFDMYATYGVPIAFAVAIVWGTDHIIQHDPDSREASATADEAELERRAQIQATEALAAQTNVVLQGSNAKELIQKAAQARALAIVSRVTQLPVLMTETRQLNATPAIEAVPVTEIDEQKPTAQYVNGAAQPDPKSAPRQTHH